MEGADGRLGRSAELLLGFSIIDAPSVLLVALDDVLGVGPPGHAVAFGMADDALAAITRCDALGGSWRREVPAGA